MRAVGICAHDTAFEHLFTWLIGFFMKMQAGGDTHTAAAEHLNELIDASRRGLCAHDTLLDMTDRF